MKRNMRFTVPRDKEGALLIDFLCARFPYFSRHDWEARIADKRLLMDGAPAQPASALRFGQLLEYLAWDIPEPDVPLNAEIIYSDDTVLVINKPAGLPCHPGGRYFNNTLWAVLKERSGVPDPVMVNRIDRETSGLVLVATSPEAAGRCQRQFANHTVEKEYLALVEGVFVRQVRACGLIGPDPDSPVRKKRRFTPLASRPPPESTGPDTKWAETDLFPIEVRGCISAVRAVPRTGRTHQIRATLQALGFPVAGDKLYGLDPGLFLRFCDGSLSVSDHARLRIARQALHSARLRFRHPYSGAAMEFEAPMPPDMLALMNG
jgi:23S rRNA pseudouridine955/2504/2580 synthase/23S rRNA pseudouridine1911/1915/1917 synthase